MPAKGKSKVSETQRRKIAAGKLAGTPSRVIAAETGLAEKTVRNQACDPRTKTLIQDLKAVDEVRLRRIWEKALKGVEKDVGAIDADVRRHARTQYFRLLTAGDPPLGKFDPGDGDGGDFTLEELLISFRRVTSGS